jgi:hypothetical protein
MELVKQLFANPFAFLNNAATVAAGIQSSIGNVVAPSLFSMLQSAAMGGYGVAVVNGAVQVWGAGLALASGGAAFVKSKM